METEIPQNQNQKKDNWNKYLVLYTDLFARSLVSMCVAIMFYIVLNNYLEISKGISIPLIIIFSIFMSPVYNKIKVSHIILPLYFRLIDYFSDKLIEVIKKWQKR
jgi:hypothetical protein